MGTSADLEHMPKRRKQKKRVSFSINTPSPIMPQLKEAHSLQLNQHRRLPSKSKEIPSLNRRHSDSMLVKIKHHQNKQYSEPSIINESKLDKDAINKIRNELLSEKKMNDRFKRHSICSA